MTCVCPVITLSPRDYDAVLFDLDGVLTRTTSVHASAWKKLFDSFLEQRATQAGEPFVLFDIDTDYPRYVDGRARYDGVAAILFWLHLRHHRETKGGMDHKMAEKIGPKRIIAFLFLALLLVGLVVFFITSG